MTPDASATWPIQEPYDFVETTRLLRTGVRDPTCRRETAGLWRTAHTIDGAATVRLALSEQRHLRAEAWGPGARAVLADVPRWLGLDQPRWEFRAHPVVDRLARAHRGVRATDTCDVFEALVVAVLQQLVTWEYAAMTWRRLCETIGAPAPGPAGLRLSPTPRAIRACGTVGLQAAGVGGRQARTLIDVARVAHAVRRVADMPTADALALLQKVPGVGQWTAATVLGERLGRPEPVPLGDVNLPHTMAWALAGEPRGSDARMLELLAPFDGVAFRVVRLVWAARIDAPRRGPRRGWQRAGAGSGW